MAPIEGRPARSGRYKKRYRKDLRGFEPDAIDALLSHPWPGNVRELDHTVERAALMAETDAVRRTDLGLALGIDRDRGLGLEEMSLEEVECVLIQKALDRHGGNVSQTARALGLSRSGLYRRLRALEASAARTD